MTIAPTFDELGIKKIYRDNIFKLLNKSIAIPGDIIELGVYKGQNSYIVGNFLQTNNITDKKYIGFDTFCGYTEEDVQTAIELGDQPDGIMSNQESGRWMVSMDDVTDRLKNENLTNYCKLIKGDIKQTVPAYLESVNDDYPIAMVYVDCNVYLPAITALRACKNFLSDGAMIVVDEHSVGGETRALIEFAQEYNVKIHHTYWEHPNGPRLYCIYKKK